MKHGLVWFERWRSAEQTQWDAYREGLPEPLSPACKGIGFNREGRLKVGFDRAYIDELEVFRARVGAVRTRSGLIQTAREKLLRAVREIWPPSRSASWRTICALPMLYCAQDDVVLVERRPSIEFLRTLRALGFTVPEFVECDSGPMAAWNRSLNANCTECVRGVGARRARFFLHRFADQLAPGETLGWQPVARLIPRRGARITCGTLWMKLVKIGCVARKSSGAFVRA